MPRFSLTAPVALAAFALFAFAGCRTMYSDVYSPRRNHFKPVKEKPAVTDLIAPPTTGAAPSGEPIAPPPIEAAPGIPGL